MKISKLKVTAGFTLVEVVVVIAIIAILTVIIFPSVNNIRAKNRDAERVSDIATIQIGLSMYYSKNGVYPNTLTTDMPGPKYIPNDALTGPAPYSTYTYVPLTKTNSGTNCSYYHLGVRLELTNAQIDTADTFDSRVPNSPNMNYYYYCNPNTGPGLTPADFDEKIYNYNVHP